MANWNRTTGEDIEAFALTIVNPASTPKTLINCFTIGTQKKQRILTWEIKDNDGAFRWSKNSAMTAPAPEIAAYEGWAPAVGPLALTNTYVESSTGGSTVSADIIVTYGDQEERTVE